MGIREIFLPGTPTSAAVDAIRAAVGAVMPVSPHAEQTHLTEIAFDDGGMNLLSSRRAA